MEKIFKRITAVLLALTLLFTGISFNEFSSNVKAAFDANDAVGINSGSAGGSDWNTSMNSKDENGKNWRVPVGYSSWEGTALRASDKSYAYRIKSGSGGINVEKGKEYNGELPESNGNKQDKGDYTWFKTSKTNSEGNISVRINDCRIRTKDANSRLVWKHFDMVCTITGINKIGEDEGYIGIGDYLMDLKYIHLKSVRIRYDFYEAGTSNAINIKTNVTLRDIDNEQFIAMRRTNIKGVYVDANTDLKWYYDAENTRDFYVGPERDSSQNDAKTAIGFLINGSSLYYTFGRYEKTGSDISKIWKIQFVGGGNTMIGFEPDDPIKKVSDDSHYKNQEEKQVTTNHLKNIYEQYEYEVEQDIPTKLSENQYYSSFELHDDVDTCLKIDDVKVYRGTNNKNDATDWFNISTANNHVSAIIKDANKSDLYSKGDVYRMIITVHIAASDGWDKMTEEEKEVVEKQWSDHGHYTATSTKMTISNKAYSYVDGKNRFTNDVYTIVNVFPKPVKDVSDDSLYGDKPEIKVTTNHLRNVMEHFKYTVEQSIPEVEKEDEALMSTFVLSDQIDTCLKISDVKMYANDTTDVTDWFDIVIENNKIVATMKQPTEPKVYDYTKYSMSIDTVLDGVQDWDNMTDEIKTALEKKWKDHGHYTETETNLVFENQAERIINSDVRITNKVKTIVELSTNDKGNEHPGLAITKDVNRYEHQVGDTIKYTVKVWNTNKEADTAGFVIKDTSLPDTVELNFDSVKVEGVEQSNYTLTKSGNGWILRSKGNYALPYGETIVITYEAKALREGNGTLVDNVASATAIGIPEKTAEAQVYINSPKVDVVKTTPSRKHKVGDTVGYEVTLTNRNPGTFMRDIVMKDVVTTKGLKIKEGTVAVIVGGKDITSTLDIVYSDDGTGFDIKSSLNLKNGTIPCIDKAPYKDMVNWCDKIKVTYEATITDEAADLSHLDNTFSAPATPNTNGDIIKDDPDIPSGGGSDDEQVNMKQPQLEITKESDKQVYKVGETGKYKLVVKQLKEELTAKNVVVADRFEQPEGLQINKDSVRVFLNNKEITTDTAITTDNVSFKVETHKNLTDEDKLLIVYDVVFTKEGEFTNKAVASSDNTPDASDDNKVTVTDKTPTTKETVTTVTKTPTPNSPDTPAQTYNPPQTGRNAINVMLVLAMLTLLSGMITVCLYKKEANEVENK